MDSLQGVEQMFSKVRKWLDEMRRTAKRTLVRGCEAIMTRSKQEFVPVREGILKGTGHVTPDPNPNVIAATLSYGGPAAAYAIVQHEDVTLRHTVGEHHYLEKPVREDGPKLLVKVHEAIKL